MLSLEDPPGEEAFAATALRAPLSAAVGAGDAEQFEPTIPPKDNPSAEAAVIVTPNAGNVSRPIPLMGGTPAPAPARATPAPEEPVPDGVAAVMRATRDPLIGSTVLGYTVKKRIGSGGMGIVYEAEQAMIGKRVALKVLRPDMAKKPDQVEALAAEARAVNRVGHRGIVDVFAFDVLPDGRQVIAMELLQGESLQDVLNRQRREGRPMMVGEVMLVLEEMLSALAAAHGAGVIHRDLKPNNIFLVKQSDGSQYVKILDFGIAKLDDGNAQATPNNASLIMGTPAYMAPEQARRGKPTPALDLYALGVIAFELLTNRQPFEGTNMVEILFHHAETPAPAPSSVLMSIPDEVDDLVLALLQKKPEDRPQDANAVRMIVKRARKLLLHSTAHPELRLSKDKATGKLILEDRATGAPAIKRTRTLSQSRAQSVGPAPTKKKSSTSIPKVATDAAERTLPEELRSRKAGPDPDATFVPGRVMAADILELRQNPFEKKAEKSTAAEEDDGERTVPPGPVPAELANSAASSKLPFVLIGVGLVLGLGIVGYTVKQRQAAAGSQAVIEEIKPAVDSVALNKRLDALIVKFDAPEARESKMAQKYLEETKALKERIARGDLTGAEEMVKGLELSASSF